MFFDISDLILQIASNVTTLAPPLPTPDNIIATTGQVEQVADQTTNTILVGLTAVGTAIGGVFAKNEISNKKNKQSIRDTDNDLVDFMELLALEDRYALQNPTKTKAEILMMRAYPDEPALTTTLAEAKAKEYKEWREFIKAKYYTNPV